MRCSLTPSRCPLVINGGRRRLLHRVRRENVPLVRTLNVSRLARAVIRLRTAG